MEPIVVPHQLSFAQKVDNALTSTTSEEFKKFLILLKKRHGIAGRDPLKIDDPLSSLFALLRRFGTACSPLQPSTPENHLFVAPRVIIAPILFATSSETTHAHRIGFPAVSRSAVRTTVRTSATLRRTMSNQTHQEVTIAAAGSPCRIVNGIITRWHPAAIVRFPKNVWIYDPAYDPSSPRLPRPLCDAISPTGPHPRVANGRQITTSGNARKVQRANTRLVLYAILDACRIIASDPISSSDPEYFETEWIECLGGVQWHDPKVIHRTPTPDPTVPDSGDQFEVPDAENSSEVQDAEDQSEVSDAEDTSEALDAEDTSEALDADAQDLWFEDVKHLFGNGEYQPEDAECMFGQGRHSLQEIKHDSPVRKARNLGD